MNRGLLSLILFVSFLSCSNNDSKDTSITDYIPNDAHVVIETDGIQHLGEYLKNLEVLKKLDGLERIKEIKQASTFLQNYDSSDNALVCLSTEGKNEVILTLVVHENDLEVVKDSSQVVEKRTEYNNHYFIENRIPGKSSYYSTQLNEYVIASNSQLVVESIIRQQESGEYEYNREFSNLYRKTSSGKGINIFLKASESNWIQTYLLSTSRGRGNALGDWMQIHPDTDLDYLRLDGILSLKDSLPHLQGIFSGMKPQEIKTTALIPSSALEASIFTYTTSEQLTSNITRYYGKRDIEFSKRLKSFLSDHNEIAQVQLSTGSVLIWSRLKSVEELVDWSDLAIEKISFRDLDIYKLEQPFSSTKLQPLISKVNVTYVVSLDEFLITSGSRDAIEELLGNYQTQATLDEQSWFKRSSEQLSSSSSRMSINFLKSVSQIASKASKKDSTVLVKADFTDYPALINQYINEKDYAHIHSILVKKDENATSNSIKQIGTYKSPTPILAGPFLFKNHRTNGHDIVIQDDKNELLLISDNGKKLWSKKLSSPIIGQVHGIDGFKNKRYQLCFATTSQLHLIDRDGNNVAPFPIDFKDPITQGVSIFDYDNNRNYRLLITQDDDLVMFDRDGKVIKGFEYKGDGTITTAPKHFRAGNKDFIAFAKANKKLSLLSRTGKDRTTVKEAVAVKDSIYFDNNLVKLVDESNEILYVNILTGAVTHTGNRIDKNSMYRVKNGVEVIKTANELVINGKEFTMPYGSYSQLYVNKLKTNSYISSMETGEHQIYMYTEKGDLVSGFPVYGSDKIAMAASKVKYLVTMDQNAVVIYSW